MIRRVTQVTRAAFVACLAALCLTMIASGCVQKKDGNKDSRASEARPFQVRYFTPNPFSSDALAQGFSTGLARLRLNQSVTTGLNEDSLWAIAQCKCSPGFSSVYTQLLAQSRGVLPAPLVPAIREEFRSNPALKAILSLPTGLKGIAGSLASIFVNDSTIAGEIHKSLDQKISDALGTGSPLSSRLPYQFDLYPAPFVNLGGSFKSLPKTFKVSDQASKWAFIFSLDNMWMPAANLQPVALGDHSLQLLLTSIAISEWTYAFGLDPTSSGTVYGGIAFDPRVGVNAPLQPSDPRVDQDAAEVISGTYNVNFPNIGSVKLATSVKEGWARNPETIPLDEQARLLAASASAYGRLKPSQRDARLTSIFDQQSGIFPDDIHTLPLVFLNGMAQLLQKSFIEPESRELHRAAAINGAQSAVSEANASLKSLARLARALQSWVIQLETINSDRLSPQVTQIINKNITSIKDGMRLAIQNILDHHTEDSVPATRLGGIAMVTSKVDFSRPPLAEVAEALAVMSSIDITTLENQPGVQTDLNLKIIALFHWFASEYLVDVASGSIPTPITPEGALWSYIALKNFSRYPAQLTRASWLRDAVRNLEAAVQDWDSNLSPTN